MIVRVLIMIAVLSSGAQPKLAHAEDDLVMDEREPDPIYIAELRIPPRKLLGLDVGIGIYDGFCARCLLTGGLSFGVFGGVQFSQRVALLADFWSLMHLLPTDSADERGLTAHTISSIAGRVWVTPQLWLQGGFGVGVLSIVGPSDDFEAGPSAMLSLGSELKHTPVSGIDLSGRLGLTRFSGDGDSEYFYNMSGSIAWHWN